MLIRFEPQLRKPIEAAGKPEAESDCFPAKRRAVELLAGRSSESNPLLCLRQIDLSNRRPPKRKADERFSLKRFRRKSFRYLENSISKANPSTKHFLNIVRHIGEFLNTLL